jgi:hypothetical protein
MGVSEALREYWGSSGKDRDGKAMREAVRKAKLTKAQAEELMDELPPRCAGPTGARIDECYRVLGRPR